MIFKENRVYDILKWLSLVALDAIGFAYEKLANIWSLPYGGQIKDTCIVVSILIGTLIGVSGIKYQNQQEFGSLTRPDEIAHDAEGEISG